MMNGMGMLHLEIKQHRMERDFRLKGARRASRASASAKLSKRPMRVEGECVRQAGGSGLFAKVRVEFRAVLGR